MSSRLDDQPRISDGFREKHRDDNNADGLFAFDIYWPCRGSGKATNAVNGTSWGLEHEMHNGEDVRPYCCAQDAHRHPRAYVENRSCMHRRPCI